MKSKTSCFNKTILKKNFTHFWPIWGVLLLYYLFLLPFMEFNYYLQEMNSGTPDLAHSILLPELTNVCIQPALLYLFSLIAAGAVFSYLYTSRAAYTIHALPVTRKSLFFTNYISGLAFLWVPQIIGVLVGILVAAGCGFSYINILFEGLFYGLGITFFFFSFNVLVGIVVGQLIAMPVFSFILNFLFVGCKLLFIALLSTVTYGVSLYFWQSRLDVLSPLYYLTGHVNVNIQYSGVQYAVCSGIEGGKIVAGYVAAAVVMIVISYLLYQKRHIESAGTLISVKRITPVFRWGVGICAASVFALMGSAVVYYASDTMRFVIMVIAAVIFGCIFFYCAQMLLEKSFKVFSKKRLKECGIFAVALVALMLLIRADVFGIEGKIPDVSDVKEAYVRGAGEAGGSSEQEISEIVKLHETILAHKEEYRDSPSGKLCYIDMKYYLKDGSTLQRSYSVPADDKECSDETSAASLYYAVITEPRTYIKSQFGLNYEENRFMGGDLEYPVEVDYGDGTKGTSSQSQTLSVEEIESLFQAFCQDVEDGNFDKQIKNTMDYESEEYKKYIYWNNIEFMFENKDGFETYDDKYFDSTHRTIYANMTSSSYITFNTDCENMISTLIELGIIESEKDLTTYWDLEQREMDAAQ